jgi:hypothetical protein
MFNDDNESDLVHVQRIAQETVEYLRELNLRITTGKVERGVIEAIRKSELLKRVGLHEQKLAQHEQNWLELAKASKGFNQIISALEKMTGKK